MREESGYRSQREKERERELEPVRRPQRPQACGVGMGSRGQILVGAVIVVVGVALLLDNLGVINSRQILQFWPLLLIGAGANDLLAARARGRAMRGTLLASAGVLFLLNNLGVVNFSIWGLWPLFLILFGVQMLTGRRSRPESPEEELAVDNAEFDDFAFLGAVKRANTSAAFRGGTATAFMGGVEIDLRKARMEGDRAVINLFAMMGGVSLRIPEDWAVESRVFVFMGGIDDKTRPPSEPTGTLILQGSAIMGGVEIKD